MGIISFHERFARASMLLLSAVIAAIIVASMIQLIAIVFAMRIGQALKPAIHSSKAYSEGR